MRLTFIALERNRHCYYSNETAGAHSVAGTAYSLLAPSSKHAPGPVPVELLSCISLLDVPHDAAQSSSKPTALEFAKLAPYLLRFVQCAPNC